MGIMKIRLVAGLALSLIVYIVAAALLDAVRSSTGPAVISETMALISIGLLEIELGDGLSFPVYPVLSVAVALGFLELSLYRGKRRGITLLMINLFAQLLLVGGSMPYLLAGFEKSVFDQNFVIFGSLVLSYKELAIPILASVILAQFQLRLIMRSARR